MVKSAFTCWKSVSQQENTCPSQTGASGAIAASFQFTFCTLINSSSWLRNLTVNCLILYSALKVSSSVTGSLLTFSWEYTFSPSLHPMKSYPSLTGSSGAVADLPCGTYSPPSSLSSQSTKRTWYSLSAKTAEYEASPSTSTLRSAAASSSSSQRTKL